MQFLVRGALDHGEVGVFISFEERPQDLALNVASLGFDLVHRVVPERVSTGLWRFDDRFDAGLIDYPKSEGITALMTSLTPGAAALERAQGGISAVLETWILVNTFELNGERNRDLSVLKSRGMSHSNQVREFVITCRGVALLDVYVGPGGVLTGCARANQEAADKRASLLIEQEIEHKRHALQRCKALQREQLAKLQPEHESEVFERESSLSALERADEQTILDRVTMARRRQADAITSGDQQRARPQRDGSGGKP
jgi:circadian clock protein KaiC